MWIVLLMTVISVVLLTTTFKAKDVMFNIVFGLLFLVLSYLVLYTKANVDGYGFAAVDRGTTALKTCQVYSAERVGTYLYINGEDRAVKIVVAINECVRVDNKNEKDSVFVKSNKQSRLYVFERGNVPPEMFVKTKDGEYVSYPGLAEYVLKGCK